MLDHAQATTASTSLAADRTDRDLQRAALHELVMLSTECAATEAQLEHDRAAAIEQAKRDLEKSISAIEGDYETTRTSLQQKHQQRHAEASERYEADLSAFKLADKAGRQRADMDAEAAEHEIKQKLDQAIWLAESLYDGTHARAHEDYRKAKEALKAHLEHLNAKEQETVDLIQRVAQRVPAVQRPPQPPLEGDAADTYATHTDAIDQHLATLSRLHVPSLFVGIRPYLIVAVALILAAMIAQWQTGQFPQRLAGLQTIQPQWREIGIATGATFGGLLVLGLALWLLARSQVRRAYAPLRQSLDRARHAAQTIYENAKAERDHKLARASKKRDLEVHAAKAKFEPMLSRARQNRDSAMRSIDGEYSRRITRIGSQRDQEHRAADEWLHEHLTGLARHRDDDLRTVRETHDERLRQIEQKYRHGREELQRRWQEGLQRISAPIEPTDDSNGRALEDWEDPQWHSWRPPQRFAATVPFGELQVDLKRIAQNVSPNVPTQLELPQQFALPALLAFPRQSSLLIQTDRTGRGEAIRTLQMVMMRLLTSLPAGRVRLTIIDPVGLGQNFAGFMHLADHDEALVGGRILTDAEHIEQRLRDLTDHMETVIQKYLRNEFETIDDYNAQAGELAEPYRFVVIADFPASFSDEALRRLSSIASTGARCGVYTLIARDVRIPLPPSMHIEDLESHSVNLVYDGERFVWKDEVFERFPLILDEPPTEQSLTQILDVVGRHARESKRVEVPFQSITPPREQLWSGDATEELSVPIGRLGATRQQTLRLGRGVAQHALIAGKTGSGKSTLLHVMVTNLAMWYSPDQVEFYLVDFKKGVEFKTYATHQLPHARAIAVESDREFGLSVLQRLDAELARRGELFRKAGVQDLAAYRRSTGQIMPRTLLIIDEFQEFFSEDDKLAQDAGLLLDRLVRQGRAFGIHVLLGSQTIGGTSGLARSTIGQMAVRIALQTSEVDSQMILGDSNSAARLLSRPGEAIYNDQGGLVEGNSPFQVAWLPDEKRDEMLDIVEKRAAEAHVDASPPVVFEGNAPSEIRKNARLMELLRAKKWPSKTGAAQAWVGEPVAIKEPTAVTFRRQSGANLLVVGQQDESAMAVLCAAMISLAAQHPPDAAKFVVFDGTPADSPLADTFARVAAAAPHESKLVEYRATADTISELHQEMTRRQGADARAETIYVILYGLQRYRVLRRQDESFNFSLDQEEKAPAPDKQFAELLREGPPLGIHVLAWCDTAISADRAIDRSTMREFDHRILFQMSATDSSNLIDSPMANKLGFYRALAYSEEQGVMEKFRPYALPNRDWLDEVARLLKRS